jgi:nicotinate phosphoribosyltransferase
MQPVITSLLDTDLYKFTMWQTMLHRHPQTQAEYTFVCRNATAYPLAELLPDVERELDHLCSLSFAAEDLAYLGSLRFIKPDFVDFLRIFRFQRAFIEAKADGDRLSIVARGPQVHVMGFEIYVLAIVNELYFRRLAQPGSLDEGRRRLQAKIELLRAFASEAPRRHPFEFFDFGLRRRFSGAWQREVVSTFKRELPQFFKGTSNVLLARDLQLVPIGTMAHEYLQTYQALGVRLRDHQKAALEDWVQEYRGDLGTALTDVVGMDAFLADFDLYFAKLFDTCELQAWTRNHEFHASWTCTADDAASRNVSTSGCLPFQEGSLQIGGASSGGQLVCPRERVRAGEPVRQPATTAAGGGRPQVEEREPVPLGARVARTGRLSTGGRAQQSPLRIQRAIPARSREAGRQSHLHVAQTSTDRLAGSAAAHPTLN